MNMEHTHLKFKICISTASNLSQLSVARALHFINHTVDFPHSILGGGGGWFCTVRRIMEMDRWFM